MWKKIRLILLITALVLAAAMVSLRLRFVEVPARAFLSDFTGRKVSFSRIAYRPFNRIVVEDLSIGDEIRCESVSVHFNPGKLLFSIKRPEMALTRIHFKSPDVPDSAAFTALVSGLVRPPSGPAPDFRVSWEDARFSQGGVSLSGASGQVRITDTVSGRMTGAFGENRLSAGVSLDTRPGETLIDLTARLVGEDTLGEAAVSVRTKEGGRAEAAVSVPALSWKGFSLGGSEGSVRLGPGSVSGSLNTPAGRIELSGTGPDDLSLAGSFDLAAASDTAAGVLEFSADRSADGVSGACAASSVSFRELSFGDAELTFSAPAGGNIALRGRLFPSGYDIQAEVTPEGAVLSTLVAGADGRGEISGSPADGFSVSFSSWPLRGLPVLSARYPDLDGVLHARGTAGGKNTDISASLHSLSCNGNDRYDIDSRILSRDGNWFLTTSAGETATLSGRRLSDGTWDADVVLDGFPVRGIPAWLGSDIPVSGTVSGAARLSSDGAGDAELTLNRPSVSNVSFDSATLELASSPGSLTVESVSLRRGKGTAVVRGSVDTGGKRTVALDILLDRFTHGTTVLSGRTSLSGAYTENPAGFKGRLASPEFAVDDWRTDDLRAGLDISTSAVTVDDLVWAPIAQGTLRCDLAANGALAGEVRLSRLPLERLSDKVKGALDGTAAVGGTLAAPSVRLSYATTGARSRGESFGSRGVLEYRDGTLHASEVRLTTGKGAATVSGRLYPEFDLTGTLSAVSVGDVAALTGVQPPFSGTLSGRFSLEGPPSAPVAGADITGTGITFGTTTLGETTASVRYSAGTISVDSLITRLRDSELRLLSGTQVDLTRRRAALKAEFRNVRAAPFVMFGSLSGTGGWSSAPGRGLSVEGDVTAEDFWINQHHLDRLDLVLRYGDNSLELLPSPGQKLALSGSVRIDSGPRMAFDRLTIAHDGGSSLTLNGTAGIRDWDFTVAGRSLPADTLAELLDVSLGVDGELDVSIVGKGSLDRPRIEGSLNLAGGTVADIPFDNANFQFSAVRDVLTILHARLVKKGQYTLAATGFTPFFLTADARERSKDTPIDVTVSIEEGSLSMLAALSKDIRSAAGSVNAQAHFTGTLSSPVVNGFLRVAGGEVTAKNFYFDRIRDLSVDCAWNDNRLDVRECTGTIGSGRTSLSGSIAFDGLAPSVYDLSWRSVGKKGISISVPELPIPTPLFRNEEFLSNLSNGEPRFDLSLTGTGEEPRLSGWVELDNTHFTYPSLVKAGEGGDGLFDRLIHRMNWDLELRSGRNSWYDNELVNVNIQGAIRLSGSGEFPTVNGHVEAIRGSIVYLGRQFRIRRATLDIVKSAVLLEAEAETDIYGSTSADNDTIQMFIDRAEIGRIKPRFVSRNNPDLSPEKALARATGIDPEAYSFSDQDYMLRQQLIRLFDSTLATPLAKILLQKSGLADSFKVQYIAKEPLDPATPGNPTLSELLDGSKYTLEKYLSDQVLVGYSLTFDQLQNKLDLRHELELSYRLRRNTFLKGIYEIDSRDSNRPSDRRITLERQWRFGWPGNNPQERPDR